jgi:hypothetical protein
MQVIRAGHILFDEQPQCNEGLVEWQEKSSQTKWKGSNSNNSTLSKIVILKTFSIDQTANHAITHHNFDNPSITR